MTRAARTTGEGLRDLLQPLIRSEVATIGAIETVMHHQKEPGYVVLHQATKTGKQANVEQMVTLLRLHGQQPSEQGGPIESILKLQSLLLQQVSTTATLGAMRIVQEDLVAHYRDVHARVDGLAREALTRPFDRAVTQWIVLIAHIVQRKEGDSSLAEQLPVPLGAYFASADDRVCMRCLFDRPGERPALERTDPRPYQYVCAACHDEVLANFPPDLLEQAMRWPDEVRRDRVVERALGRPETLRATQGVVALLSGLEPEEPEVRRSGVKQVPRARVTIAPPATREAPVVDLPRHNASASELAYTDLLFDFASVRRNW